MCSEKNCTKYKNPIIPQGIQEKFMTLPSRKNASPAGWQGMRSFHL